MTAGYPTRDRAESSPVMVPHAPALVAGFREVVWLSPDGEIEALSPDEARDRLDGGETAVAGIGRRRRREHPRSRRGRLPRRLELGAGGARRLAGGGPGGAARGAGAARLAAPCRMAGRRAAAAAREPPGCRRGSLRPPGGAARRGCRGAAAAGGIRRRSRRRLRPARIAR